MVLIAIDEPLILKSLRIILQREGFDVQGVGSGEEAWDVLKERKPDLLLLNAFLPDTEDLELLRAVRRNDRLKDLPVAVMSSDLRMKKKAEPLGIVAFFHKPFPPEELLEVISSWSRRSPVQGG
jgi:DNA-binding response OmpR family regulator